MVTQVARGTFVVSMKPLAFEQAEDGSGLVAEQRYFGNFSTKDQQ